MYNDKIKIATHSEIDDKEQSIFIPKIGTKLTEKDSGEKEMHAFEDINLTDEIGYENLLVGAKYFVKGRVINKKTGETIAEAEREFSPEKESGLLKLDFALNAGKLNGASLVCFEEIYSTDGEGKPAKLVAEHKDINDESQSVKIIKKELTKTGDSTGTIFYILGLAIAAIAVVTIKYRKFR